MKILAWSRKCMGGHVGSAPGAGNGRDRPEKAAGKEGGAGRAGCPDKPSDAAGGLLPGDPEAAGGFWARATSQRRSRCVSIAPSSLLALTQNPLRHGRCGYRVADPGAARLHPEPRRKNALLRQYFRDRNGTG